ncbi:MAG TPA: hypothetical protein PLL78_13445 [Fimbriimonadaceae bacterium]|nr:hypothetical protein [Fimbriimonadaceae bacterium]HRJ97681.1 hypothetical protein [Fimbriimonadaceae bacterium]
MRPIRLLGILLICILFQLGLAQTNVTAVHANGQTFVSWRVQLPLPTTYEIYRSSTSFTDTSQATLVGRILRPEWEGDALDQIASPLSGSGSTWVIPNGAGGTVQLPIDRGLFVYTPHAAATEYFAVVETGNTTVTADHITPTPVTQTYQPLANPVTAHPQLSGITPEGYLFRVYAYWTDGRNDIEDARADYPVMGNFAKNGAPNIFVVYSPSTGPGTAPYPMTFGFHGGEGNFHLWRPGLFPNVGLTIDEGIFVAPHDILYHRAGGSVTSATTGWFGYYPDLDPLNVNPISNPPANAVIQDYTQRKVNWIRQWLLRGGDLSYQVDTTRISLLGHSMGGRGISILSRRNPERYAACHMFTPAYRDVVGANPFYGNEALNLETNMIGPGGATMRMNDIFDWTQPLSQTQRDLCLTRIYSGKNDAVIGWDSTIVGEITAANDSAMGFHLYWDSRPHGIANWSQSPYFAEWIVPSRTDRGSARYAQRYRSNQSFPAFFNDDQDVGTAGRQPDIGTGNPTSGAVWGTWGGYYDWDLTAIVDTPLTWGCTLWLVGSAPATVDNCPVAVARTSIAVRKPQAFRLPPFYPFRWTLRRTDTNALLASGLALSDASGVVRITNLLIAREDVFKSRLEVVRLPIPKP